MLCLCLFLVLTNVIFCKPLASRVRSTTTMIPFAPDRPGIYHGLYLGIFKNVVYHPSIPKLTFYNLDMEAEVEIRSKIFQYRHFVNNNIVTIPTQLEFINDTLFSMDNNQYCRGENIKAGYLMSPWVVNNNYHMHNDNILCAYISLLYAHYAIGAGEIALITFNTNGQPSYRPRQVTTDIINLIFPSTNNQNRARGTSELTQKQCFETFIFGRGPYVGYYWDTESWVAIHPHMMKYRSIMYSLVSVNPNLYLKRSKPLVFILKRDDWRATQNFHELAKLLQVRGFDTYMCCDFSKISTLRGLLDVGLKDAIALVGDHGAGLANSVYLPPGRTTTIVELMGGHAPELCTLHTLARYSEQTHVYADSRSWGKNIPELWLLKIADFVAYNFNSNGKGYESDMIVGNTPNTEYPPHGKDQEYFELMPGEPFIPKRKMKGGPFIG